MVVLCKIRFFKIPFLLNSGVEVGFAWALSEFFSLLGYPCKYFALPASLVCVGVQTPADLQSVKYLIKC